MGVCRAVLIRRYTRIILKSKRVHMDCQRFVTIFAKSASDQLRQICLSQLSALDQLRQIVVHLSFGSKMCSNHSANRGEGSN